MRSCSQKPAAVFFPILETNSVLTLKPQKCLGLPHGPADEAWQPRLGSWDPHGGRRTGSCEPAHVCHGTQVRTDICTTNQVRWWRVVVSSHTSPAHRWFPPAALLHIQCSRVCLLFPNILSGVLESSTDLISSYGCFCGRDEYTHIRTHISMKYIDTCTHTYSWTTIFWYYI